MHFRIEWKFRGKGEDYWRLFADNDTEFHTREAATRQMREVRAKYEPASPFTPAPYSFRVKGHFEVRHVG